MASSSELPSSLSDILEGLSGTLFPDRDTVAPLEERSDELLDEEVDDQPEKTTSLAQALLAPYS